jgi:hypothetical protein
LESDFSLLDLGLDLTFKDKDLDFGPLDLDLHLHCLNLTMSVGLVALTYILSIAHDVSCVPWMKLIHFFSTVPLRHSNTLFKLMFFFDCE